jgi:hypothetical protein
MPLDAKYLDVEVHREFKRSLSSSTRRSMRGTFHLMAKIR